MHPLILIVDDEPNIRHSLMRLMESEGLHAFAASDSESALTILRDHPIDVVISDERMPGMSGSEFLVKVRERYPQTIRIILTGQASVEAMARAINEGEIFRFVLKPWDDEELLSIIVEAMERRGNLNEQAVALRKHQQKRHLIEELEKQFPGIGKVKRDVDGTIIL